MDADEFSVIDNLPRVVGPQATPDAPTRRLAAARDTDTRPLLAEEYPAHVAARMQSFRIWQVWRSVFAGGLATVLLQIIGYFLMRGLIQALTPVNDDPWYTQPSPSYTWLYYIPTILTVVLAAGIWRKSRALLVGILVTLLLLAPIWTSYGDFYREGYIPQMPPPPPSASVVYP